MRNDYEISSVLFYDDMTNQVRWDACRYGISFSDVEAVREMIQVVRIDGCKRIRIISSGDDYEYSDEKQVFLYNYAEKWTTIKGECASLIGLKRQEKRFNITCVEDDDESFTQGDDNEFKFWQLREKIRVILADLDPFGITNFPLKYLGISAYAKEAYLMTEKILLYGADEKVVRNAVRYAFTEADGHDLSDENTDRIIKRLLHGDDWHACPVCKENFFYSEGEKCPVCGWVNDLRMEKEQEIKHIDHGGYFDPLDMWQLQYYLAKHEGTEKIVQELMAPYVNPLRVTNIQERIDLQEEYKKLLAIYAADILGIDKSNLTFEVILTALEHGYDERVAWLQDMVLRQRNCRDISLKEYYESGMLSRNCCVSLKKLETRTLGDAYELGTRIFNGGFIDEDEACKLVQLFDCFQFDTKELHRYMDENWIW